MKLDRIDYTRNELGLLAEEFCSSRLEILFAVDDDGMDHMAEIEYLKAMTHYEQAYLCLKQAHYYQVRALGGAA